MELFCVEEIRKEKIRKDFRRGAKMRARAEPRRGPPDALGASARLAHQKATKGHHSPPYRRCIQLEARTGFFATATASGLDRALRRLSAWMVTTCRAAKA